MVIFTEININKRHKINFVNLVNNFRNFIFYNDRYYEYKNFKNYFIRYHYRYYELQSILCLNYLGELHRFDGPAYIYYDKNGKINEGKYYLNDKNYVYEDYILEIKKLV